MKLAGGKSCPPLVVGGVLLFQSLTREETGVVEPQQFVLDDYFNQELADVTADLARKQKRARAGLYRSDLERLDDIRIRKR